MVILEEKAGVHQTQSFFLWGPFLSEVHSLAIDLVVVDVADLSCLNLYRSGGTNRMTDTESSIVPQFLINYSKAFLYALSIGQICNFIYSGVLK